MDDASRWVTLKDQKTTSMRRSERLSRPRERRVTEAGMAPLEEAMRLQGIYRERSRSLVQIPRVVWLPSTGYRSPHCGSTRAPNILLRLCQGVVAPIPPQMKITLVEAIYPGRTQRVRTEPWIAEVMTTRVTKNRLVTTRG